MLTEFWEKNKGKEKNEQWGAGNTYTNHWQSPTMMLSVENAALPGGGFKLKNKIWDAARETIQEWTGQDLTPSSLYGIRIYKEGAVLAPHVDRLPLVSSAIINVAQDVDEDWPIEVCKLLFEICKSFPYYDRVLKNILSFFSSSCLYVFQMPMMEKLTI